MGRTGSDDDLDFDAFMRDDGARPLSRAEEAAASRLRPGRPASEVAPAPPAPPVGPDPRIAALEAEVLAARALTLEARGAAAAAGARVGELEDRVKALELEVATAALQVKEARRLVAARDAELARRPRAGAATAGRADRAARGEAAPKETRSATRLNALLEARGLVDADERAAGLAAVLGTDSARALIDKLGARDGDGVASILERKLALLCGAPGCAAPEHAAVFAVPPERCEICGGSDIQRAARAFAEACAGAGVTRVRLVGGSPSYKTQIEALFPRGGALTVLITEGGKKVPLNRSKAQQRGDDLVIIWGATELDHATSGAYRKAYGRVFTIANRGIGRMLELAAAEIARG